MNKLILKLAFISSVVFLSSCVGDSSPGYEFMPNMYRSPSWETYGENTINGMNAQLPVKGTIAKGHLSSFPFDGTDSEYRLAGGYKLDSGGILVNHEELPIYLNEDSIPIILTADTTIPGASAYPEYFRQIKNPKDQGEKLYAMMCSHCHGDNGEGDGDLKKNQIKAYSAVPAYNNDITPRLRADVPMSELKAGHIFHAITYGLQPLMGAHASQITEEERWLIVNYIQQELQNYGK